MRLKQGDEFVISGTGRSFEGKRAVVEYAGNTNEEGRQLIYARLLEEAWPYQMHAVVTITREVNSGAEVEGRPLRR